MSEAATKADITELLEVFRESNARLQSSFAEELKAAKTRIQEENKKSVEVLERKLAAVSENKWKREGNRRQFEFNQLSYGFLFLVFLVLMDILCYFLF